MFFSHILYIYQLMRLLLKCFSPVPFGKERLGEEWKKRKKTFAKMPYRFGIIIISHYYASYINLNVPQRAFLLKLVFHSLLHLLSNKPIYMASFSIYEVYRELAGRVYFSSIRVSKRYTKRRILPYFSQHIWKMAVTEYMTFYAI